MSPTVPPAPDCFLPPEELLPAKPANTVSNSPNRLRGNVLRFEREERDRFCRGLGVLRGDLRELTASPGF